MGSKCVIGYNVLRPELDCWASTWTSIILTASLWLRPCCVDTKYSVIRDGEITPASRPNPFTCLWYDIHYQRMVPPNRLHCSLLDCEWPDDNRHNSSPAETSMSVFISCWFLLGVAAGAFVCKAKQGHSNLILPPLIKHRCQQQTPSAMLTTS